MGSISTVSSKTFKTYCFMAEKKRKGRIEMEMEKKKQGQGGWWGGGDWEGSNGVERRDNGGGTGKECGCPQGESKSVHPSLQWPADVVKATSWTLSLLHLAFLYPNRIYTRLYWQSTKAHSNLLNNIRPIIKNHSQLTLSSVYIYLQELPWILRFTQAYVSHFISMFII